MVCNVSYSLGVKMSIVFKGNLLLANILKDNLN